VKLIIEFEVDESFSIGKFGRLVNFAEKVGAKFKEAHTIRHHKLKKQKMEAKNERIQI